MQPSPGQSDAKRQRRPGYPAQGSGSLKGCNSVTSDYEPCRSLSGCFALWHAHPGRRFALPWARLCKPFGLKKKHRQPNHEKPCNPCLTFLLLLVAMSLCFRFGPRPVSRRRRAPPSLPWPPLRAPCPPRPIWPAPPTCRPAPGSCARRTSAAPRSTRP